MSAVTQALYERLSADPELAAILSSWNGRPSVFSSEHVPPEAKRPYISIARQDVEPFDCKDRNGYEVRRLIAIYDDEGMGIAKVEHIAERVRTLLHRVPLDVEGHQVFIAEASGPAPMPTDETLVGLAISLRTVMMVAS